MASAERPQGVQVPPVSSPNATVPLADVQLLYEEGPCLVVCKPGGLLTQAPPGIDSLELRVKRLLAGRAGAPPQIYLGVPHRLDRPASGALVLATTRRATRRLAEQFEGRLVSKCYWALVEGQVAPAEGVWSDFLRKVPDQACAEIVEPSHRDARLAELRYRVLSQGRDFTCLEIDLLTGRTHQVRVQAATRGHPILGDEQYGSRTAFGPQAVDPRERWIALHARHLSFAHPRSRQPVEVAAPLPSCWDAYGAAGQ